MKTLLTTAAVAFALGAVSCSNPCTQLAKAVCDKTKDAKLCDPFKEKMKTADKAQCKEQLKDVDKVVTGLRGETVKQAFKDFAASMAQKLVGGGPAPAPAPGTPAPAPAPAGAK